MKTFSNIITNLDELHGVTITECMDLLTVRKYRSFQFTLCIMHQLLKMIELTNKNLQSRESGLANALLIINSIYSCIKDYRTDTVFHEVIDQCNDLSLENNDFNLDRNTPEKSESKCKKIRNQWYTNFSLTV